mgnify:FL=1
MLKEQNYCQNLGKGSIKKSFLLFVFFLFGFSLNACAQLLNNGGSLGVGLPSFEQKYDWQSGNSYSIQRDRIGKTRINGFNTSTGSQWSTNIDREGNF